VLRGRRVLSLDETATQAIAEFGGRILAGSGELLSKAGYPCEIAPPSVIRGTNVAISESIPALVIPLSTSLGKMELHVALEEEGR